MVSEILILDSGSVDGTARLARAAGASFHAQPFAGYGPQKRAASRLAANDWILNLDADEVPEPDFWKGLAHAFRAGEPAWRAATVGREFVLFGEVLRHGGAGEQRKVRLFHRRYFDWNEAPVHEDVVSLAFVEAASLSGHVEGRILHHSWESVGEWLRVTDDRAGVIARRKFGERGERASDLALAFQMQARFFLEFTRGYVLRLGFLDGPRGFVFCFFMAFSHALKFIKAYELRHATARADGAPAADGPFVGEDPHGVEDVARPRAT